MFLPCALSERRRGGGAASVERVPARRRRLPPARQRRTYPPPSVSCHCATALLTLVPPGLSVRRRCYGLDPKHINATVITQKVIQGVYDGVTTTALDDLAAETAAYLTTQHPDYARLAARISVSNLHKDTDKSFSQTMRKLHSYVNPRNGQDAPLI